LYNFETVKNYFHILLCSLFVFLDGGLAVYAASNASFVVNGISSPALRSAVVSPLAAGAGHIAGGTTANLIAGQDLGDAFANSFEGLGKSMAINGVIGVAATIVVSYANKVSPWTGNKIARKTPSTHNFTPNPERDNVRLYRGTTGNENGNGSYH
jgi:hypothetical protein